MDIVDANVLLYAVNEESDHHRSARAWLDQALGGPGGVGMAWTVTLGFLRIATNRRIFPAPLMIGEALEQVEAWLDAPAAVVVGPTPRHLGILAGLLGEAATGANLVTDAHLAALAVEYDATIVTFDRDFGRFTGVRHRIPERVLPRAKQ